MLYLSLVDTGEMYKNQIYYEWLYFFGKCPVKNRGGGGSPRSIARFNRERVREGV